jgi:chemotaxis protein methyltransferase CheR
VIERFYQSLNEGGYLFSGGTETMYGISDKFELVDIDHAMVYKKIPAKELKPAGEKVWPWQPEPQITQMKEQITQIPTKPTLVEPAKSLKDAHQLYEKAKEDFIKKDYEAAKELAKNALEIEPGFQEAHILLANILVNQGRFQEAEQECHKAININFLSAEPRYLLGLIYKKKAQYKEALDALTKAIYLNTNYSLAYFTIADLYREKGQAEEATKAYKNTLKALEQESEEHFRESSGGLTKKVFAQVCVRNMKELSSVR